ncbi:putative regulator of nonsense transcripts 3A [Halenospora varia]|nr:putative regulator of nonsense transcripts 3A [Halenospora varia]
MAASSAQNSNRSQANGVLPVPASQTASNPRAGPKPQAPKLKVIIRRLPPGLTEAEFVSILGDEWKLSQGKVDWFLYKPGKDSKDPSKPSRPSRAYLHLTNESHLLALSESVRLALFDDAANTFTSPCLIGPPTVEFAPYGRTPGGRRRADARAGTIDQDPEFMAFLEGLANPVTTKEVNAESLSDGTAAKQDKVTITPLVQFLKDKKANKSKEAAVKAAKKQEAQLAKGKAAKESPEDLKKKGKDGKADKLVEKAAKEAVKILNREASTKAAADSKSEASNSESSSAPKLDLGRVPGRQRGAVIAAHIKMLQRDLGLSPAQAHRQVRRDTADAQKAERLAAAEKATSEAKNAAPTTPQSPTVPTAPKAATAQPNSRRSRAKATNESDSNKASSSATPTAPAASTPVQAFIKHANPSQGVTEALLKEAMEKFGAVSMVEIDKRKGFAYVDFIESEGLKKAMAANPIPVAQGTVQVMQRKGTALPPEKKPVHPVHHAPHPPHAPHTPHAPARGGRGGRGGSMRRGGRGGGRGGGNAAPASAPTGPSGK